MDTPNEENPKFSELLKALNDNDPERFQRIASSSVPRDWCQVETTCGHTLLQEAISQQRKEIFDYLLQILDKTDLEAANSSRRETALEYALSKASVEEDTIDEYCASELIKKCAFPRGKYKNGNLLHVSIINGLFDITKLLLERDFDVNFPDWYGNTILHKSLVKSPNTYNDEIIAAFLYYGADPSMESYTGCNAFELSVLHNQKLQQEILFNYIFDKYTACKIHIYVLLKLARAKSPLFHEVLKHDVKCVVAALPDTSLLQMFKTMLVIDFSYLEILVQKFNSVICKMCSFESMRHRFSNNTILETLPLGFVQTDTFLTHPYIYLEYQIICSRQPLSRLSILIETSEKLKEVMIKLITNLNGSDICKSITYISKGDENFATQLLLYMIQYGLICDTSFLHIVYTAYGYCDLFKFLLNSEFNKLPHFSKKNIIVSLILNPTLDIRTIVEFPARFLDMESTSDLLYYFAHPKLQKFLFLCNEKNRYSDNIMSKMLIHQKVPRLVEVARDVFRQYLHQRFDAKTFNRFLELVERLPISRCYKKIVLFETKLYR